MKYQGQDEFIKNLPNNKYIKPYILIGSYGAIQNTGRVERILKLIIFLKEWHNISEIANHLDVSKKSAHRYISLLLSLGFHLEHIVCRYNLYRITNTKQFFQL